MRIEPIHIADKLGRDIVLRSALPEDADALIQYLKITAAETPFLIREPDEVSITKEQEVSFIESCLSADNSLMLIAAIDGTHIGNCSLNPIGRYRRYAHRCDVAIALYKEYCGFGIGRQMLETVLSMAKEIGFEQAELEVVSANSAAIALYEKVGFVKYGTFPNNMKYSDGSYVSADWMMKKL